MIPRLKKWWDDHPGEAFHDDFKIVSHGKELPYPYLRLLLMWGIMFMLGYLCGVMR